jgi:biopolymer transport protein ExbD
MAMNTGVRGGASAEMNVTPLIDVLLVLLIIFLLIQPPHQWQERVELPQKADTPDVVPPDRTIVIQIKESQGDRPNLKINEESVPWEKLEPRLQAIFRPRAEKVAFLKGDPEIDFQFVADVIDITHHAGVDRVGLMGDGDWANRNLVSE